MLRFKIEASKTRKLDPVAWDRVDTLIAMFSIVPIDQPEWLSFNPRDLVRFDVDRAELGRDLARVGSDMYGPILRMKTDEQRAREAWTG